MQLCQITWAIVSTRLTLYETPWHRLQLISANSLKPLAQLSQPAWHLTEPTWHLPQLTSANISTDRRNYLKSLAQLSQLSQTPLSI